MEDSVTEISDVVHLMDADYNREDRDLINLEVIDRESDLTDFFNEIVVDLDW